MKILITNITDSGILRVRVELIKSLIESNHCVIVCAPLGNAYIKLEEIGCRYIPISLEGHGKNLFKECKAVKEYYKILKQVQPDVVLSYTIKPNLYCGIACKILKIPQIMNVTGLGVALAYPSLTQSVLIRLYRYVAKNVRMIFFQNSSNLEAFRKWHIASEDQYKLIPGSGVNLNDFSLSPYPLENKGLHFLFISRILKEKGIDNYLEAAKYIKLKYPNTFFHVLGNATGNYDMKLGQANKEGYIVYHGRVNNVPDFQKMSHCTVLPSYYPEGMCNVLLEAAASGRPVITCDHPGCRETVANGVTGFLVKPNDSVDLINKIEQFIHLPYEKKKEMGLMGRKKMEKEFDRQIIVNAYIQEIYNQQEN